MNQHLALGADSYLFIDEHYLYVSIATTTVVVYDSSTFFCSVNHLYFVNCSSQKIVIMLDKEVRVHLYAYNIVVNN